MKKLIILCAVVLGFTFAATAQDNTKPEFKFNEEKHDFGKIAQGKPVTTLFEYTNVGEQPLILTAVQPTCGCTIADYTKTPVKKGDKGTIKITYNAAVAQPFTKTITVTSNAATPTKILYIVGEVIATPATADKAIGK
ncbi:MAG: DUF1573 domain-containing protein [Bacteroidota bacterium]